MAHTNKKKVLKSLIVTSLIVLLGAVMLTLLILVWVHSSKLEAELGSTSMELYLRNLSLNERQLREDEETRISDEELNLRQTAMNNLIENDEKEILMLVNPWNSLDESYEPRLVDIGDDLQFDERAAGALKNMLNDCKAAQWAPCPLSTYRTQEYQQMLFDDKIQRLISGGLATTETAYSEAAKEVAVPGTSEHQTGFAADIVDEYYPELSYSQKFSDTQKWLMEHCYDYGFILRFPEDKEEETGIIFEPWHYRYVGKKVAGQIKELDITFEEYVEKYLS